MAERLAIVVDRFMAGRAFTCDPGVVAVSGGADSVALLRAIIPVRSGPLTVTHFNHHLRGVDSDTDADFVRAVAARHGLAYREGGADVAGKAAAAGHNLEATARRLRYAWFTRVAHQIGASWVATGHTADDQAETVLHRMIRGTGLRGLRGIAADRPPDDTTPPAKVPGVVGKGVRVIRPLLTVTRRDVLHFLESVGQPFRDDSSNGDPRFTRNRIRADLIPLLRTFNPDCVTALGRLASQADEAHRFVTALGTELLARAERPRARAVVVLDTSTLIAAPRLVLREAVRQVWEREGWPLDRMGYEAWERAVAVVTGVSDGWGFPGGISARRSGRVVRFGRVL